MIRGLYIVLWLLLTTLPATLPAADFFWVGGSGRWSDINHWARTSGGAPAYTYPPTSADHVYFDERSFNAPNQRVQLDRTGYCRDMDWTGAAGSPGITGTDTCHLFINGSLVFIPEMVVDLQGDLHFTAAQAGQTIQTAGHSFRRHTFFEGTGAWVLQSPLGIDSLLQFRSGAFYSQGYPIHCNALSAKPNAPLLLSFSASTITITGRYFFADNWWQREWLSAEFRLDNLQCNNPNATLDFRDAEPALWLFGNTSFLFGTIRFSNPASNGNLINEHVLPTGTQLHKLELHGHTNLSGSLRIDTLQLNAGKTYTLSSNQRIILQHLEAVGTCPKPIRLQSAIPGFPAFLESNGSTVTASFIQLKDIRATGSSPFQANQSTDLGGNIGWTILPAHTGTLYWVGGSGNWNDPAHWAWESGGIGGTCIPSPSDDVFFDNASFPSPSATVVLDSIGFCRSINWTGATGNPRLEGSDSISLYISGSLTLAYAMQFQLKGDLYFESDHPENSLFSAGQVFGKNVYFKGTGSWKLSDSLRVRHHLYLIQGTLDARDQYISCQGFISLSAFTRTLDLRKATIQLQTPDYQNLSWQIASRNLTLYATNSTLEFMGYSTFHSEGGQALRYHNLHFRQPVVFLNPGENTLLEADSLFTYQRASFSGGLGFKYWQATHGYTYTLDAGHTLVVDELKTSADCSHLLELRSSRAGEPAFLQLNSPDTLSYLLLQDIHVRSNNPLPALQSVDAGNNRGWLIQPATGRTLYWVNNGGTWSDPAHWSEDSGGKAGACPPSPADTVYFDAHSFSENNQFVFTDGTPCYVHTLFVNKTEYRPSLVLNQLELFGSFYADSSTQASSIFQLTFRGESSEQLQPANVSLQSLNLESSGILQAAQPLQLAKLEFRMGTFETSGYDMELGSVRSFKTYQAGQRAFRFENSQLLLRGQDSTHTWRIETPVALIPDNSSVEIVHPIHLYQVSPLRFHQLTFSSETGHSILEQQQGTAEITHLKLRGDATLFGAYQIDSLTFTAGHRYLLDANYLQHIEKYWYMRGNACRKIQLQSTLSGQMVRVSLNQALVSADFVEMKNQQAVGSGMYFAGTHSSDLSESNKGWIFGEVPGQQQVGILGEDRIICTETTPVLLDARMYAEDVVYQWTDGETLPWRVIEVPGTYQVAITYNDQCVVRDTVQVSQFQALLPSFPADTTLCTGDSLRLHIGSLHPQISWEWSDGSRDSLFTSTQNGQIGVSFRVEGCTEKDSIHFQFKHRPMPELGPDRMLCYGATDTLSTTYSTPAQIRWQDGSTLPYLPITQAGTYSVEITVERCAGTDTIEISYLPPLEVALGADTFFCEGSSLVLTPVHRDTTATLRWQDGSTGDSMPVSRAGYYWVEAQVGQCRVSDSIQVNKHPLPYFDLGESQVICLPGQLPLTVPITAESYAWSNGASTRQTSYTHGDWIWAEAHLNGCSWRDSLFLSPQAAPVFSLGEDTTICTDRPLLLSAPITGLRYRWQDGSRRPTQEVSEPGVYVLEISDGTCTYIDTIDVLTRRCVRFQVYIPNAFSPDGNGINDLFQPFFPEGLQILNYELTLYDRWGNRCFQSGTPETTWDGRIRGQQAPPGMYYYALRLRYRDEDTEEAISRNGEVLLMSR